MSTRISHLNVRYDESPEEGATLVGLEFQVPGGVNLDIGKLRRTLEYFFNGIYIPETSDEALTTDGRTEHQVDDTGDYAEPDANAGLDPNPLPYVEPPKPTRRKRRTKAEMQAAREAEAVAEDQAVVAHQETEAADAVPEPPTTRRRRRRAAATDQTETDGKTDAKPPKSRRRRSKPTAAEAGPVSAEVTDLDLSRAASNAAVELTPKGVFKILDNFGADTAKDVKPKDRTAFLARLSDAVAKAK